MANDLSYKMTIVRWINIFSTCVQNDLMLYIAILYIINCSEGQRIYFFLPLGNMTSVQQIICLLCAVVYIYMMQAILLCHFLTNTCRLFITNGAHELFFLNN